MLISLYELWLQIPLLRNSEIRPHVDIFVFINSQYKSNAQRVKSLISEIYLGRL